MSALRAYITVCTLLADDALRFVVTVQNVSIHGHIVALDLLVAFIWSRFRAVLTVFHEALGINTFVAIFIEPIVLNAFVTSEGITLTLLALVHLAS